MRTIKRLKLRLPNLVQNKAVRDRQQRIERWLQTGRTGEKPAVTDFWNKDDVRGALAASQGLVCAYCQAKLEIIDRRTTVDHFRPQNKDKEGDHEGYLWLCYDWSNLSLTCDTCNGGKGSLFPLSDPTQRVTYSDRHLLAREDPLILDPCDPEIPDLFTLSLSTTYPWVQMEINHKHPLAEKAKVTVEGLKLNGHGRRDLVNARHEVMTTVLEKLEQDDTTTIAEASSYMPFNMFTRWKVQDKAPERLPTQDDELFFFLELQRKHLQQMAAEQAYFETKSSPSGKRYTKKEAAAPYQKARARIYWIFACLEKDHALGTLVEAYVAHTLPKQAQIQIKRKRNKLDKPAP